MTGERRRIRGWMLFDVAQQPYATLGLTFVFGPYFVSVAQDAFAAQGAAAPDARAQALWNGAQLLSGLLLAALSLVLGVLVDRSGRKLPWILGFSALYVACAWSLWWLAPDGANLVPVLVLFSLGFVAGEAALNLNNAQLPAVAPDRELGRVSGSGAALGYWGGVAALVLVLLLLVEDPDTGRTLAGIPPILGLDPAAMEGTRAVGPFIAVWMVAFLIPYVAWTGDTPTPPRGLGVAAALREGLADAARRPSFASLLVASMLQRDGLAALYAFGGVYASLVLGWSILTIGVFGIVAAIAAAVLTWLGGRADRRWGPKPVVVAATWALIAVCAVVVGVSREALFGVPLAPGSRVPDALFFLCGALIGGAGGAAYAASRTLVARHAAPGREGEAFGLFGFTGKATAFLAPALIGAAAWVTDSIQLRFVPVIALFLAALWLLRWTEPQGDRPR